MAAVDDGSFANATIYPAGIVVDRDGNVYSTDNHNKRVVKLDVRRRMLVHIAGTSPGRPLGDGSPATEAALTDAQGLAMSATGDLYIAEFSANRIRKVDALTGLISTVAGTGTAGFSSDGGPAVAATLNGPARLALDSKGNLLWTGEITVSGRRKLWPHLHCGRYVGFGGLHPDLPWVCIQDITLSKPTDGAKH